MNIIEYEYLDAKGNEHTIRMSPITQELSDIVWEIIVQIFNSMKRNGIITSFEVIIDTTTGKIYG